MLEDIAYFSSMAMLIFINLTRSRTEKAIWTLTYLLGKDGSEDYRFSIVPISALLSRLINFKLLLINRIRLTVELITTAPVTGGGRGIGKETAIMLAKKGMNVVVCSRIC